MLTFITFLAGILVTAAGFYFRSCMLLAQQQKIAALRFHAYLTYWQKWMLENDLFKVYHIGIKWNEEEIEIARKGGRAEELVELEKEKRKIADKIKEEMEKANLEWDKESFVAQLTKLPPDSMKSMLDHAKVIRQNLIDGKTYVTDQEAAILGFHVVRRTIELKMRLISTIDLVVQALCIALVDPTGFEIKQIAGEVSKVVWEGIRISKNIDSLSKDILEISRKSLIRLTKENIRNEFSFR